MRRGGTESSRTWVRRFGMVKILILSLIFHGFGLASGEAGPDGWKLFWAEEFEGEEIDREVWSQVKRGRSDWNNMMTENPRAVRVKDGVVRLWGVENPKKGGQQFLTGGLVSKGKFDFEYGKVMIRARFKSAKGAWPALWMLKSDAAWGKPGMGEIDLMEHLNFDDKVYQTVHSFYTVKQGGKVPQKSGTAKISKDDWNTYGMEWDKEKIVFTVNGKKTHTYPKVPEMGVEQYPFTGKFYFLLSMQIGGDWVGEADPKDYPAWMEVDWVRVFKRGV